MGLGSRTHSPVSYSAPPRSTRPRLPRLPGLDGDRVISTLTTALPAEGEVPPMPLVPSPSWWW
jgi:hypothetical protein